MRWKSFLILLSLILIPASTISLLVYYQSNTILERQVIERNEQNLRHIEHNLLEVMNGMEELSSYIIYSEEFRQYMTLPVDHEGSDPEEMQRLQDHIRGFFTFHLNNKSYVHSAQVEGINGTQLHLGERISGDELLWEEQAEDAHGKIVWTDPYAMESEGWVPEDYQMISLFREINNLFDITEPIGQVRIRLDERELYSYMTNGYLNPNDETVLLQKDGRVLSHQDHQLVGESYPNDYVVQQMQDKAGPFQYDEENGDAYYAVTRKVEGRDLYLVSTVSEDYILDEFTGIRKTMQIIMIVAGVIGLIAFVGFMLTIIKPITELTRETRRLEDGDFSAQVRVRSDDELGQLGSRFNKAVVQIQHLIDTKYKLEIQNKDSELKALQSQINPHFLYNTLDMIRWTARMEGANDTGKSIEDLSRLFRISLSQGKLWISLKEELSYVQSYLELQKRRLGGQLTFSVRMETGTEQCLILKLLLQPLVENSLEHGFSELDPANSIAIRAYRKGEVVVIDVIDNGKGLPVNVQTFNESLHQPNQQRHGYALRNIHERLVNRFGPECGLKALDSKQGTHIRISIPYRVKEGER
ncbi:two-component system sensor histidine kinase YesM [Alkalicoccobacillus murimartini]|uniref:Two-component system sensor histidine kinase YesM n=1 Tax=Alkalicoccobacillus murimartini TaxID=171685 RepID=A0ABT9YGI7_9BACI|nr:two-component system sensor histidine kinase YesM [Alkalicoccobacillus murimartini]